MRVLNMIFAALLILFAAVQYNDPDGPFWVVVYGLGAIWCVIAALRPGLFAAAPFFGYLATMAGAVAGVIWFWPTTPRWWMQDVWWETETAREGMGMMILVIALIPAAFVALRVRRAA